MASNSVKVVRQIFNAVTKGRGFDRVLDKVRVVEGTGNGRCVCEMTVDEEHENRGATLHGGLTATLVDVISTVALMTGQQGTPGVSVDLSVSYMKAAKKGDEIVIDAQTLRVGKTLAFLSVDVRNKADGQLIAQGKHTKHIGSS